ncbi:MAG TPA: hypothetical protein VFL95_04335 [Gemmatimonadales bacterium]|nr:hypothetical protein [Gemmatimonadales bacterium]
MPRPLATRLKALCLLLILMGSGGGLPSLDVVLYHWARAGQMPPPVHIEAQTTNCHAEQCTLALTSLLSEVTVPPFTRLAIVGHSLTVAAAPIAPAVRDQKSLDLPRSRAPPRPIS